MAIYGWDSSKQAALYTRAANRKRLVKDAIPLVDPDYKGNGSVHTFEDIGGRWDN